jgi:hypothetical protein
MKSKSQNIVLNWSLEPGKQPQLLKLSGSFSYSQADSRFLFRSSSFAQSVIGNLVLSGNVGIGTSDPYSHLEVAINQSAVPRGIFSTNTFEGTAGGYIALAKSRGGTGTKTAVVSGDVLGNLAFWGHDGGDWVIGAAIKAVSNGVIAAGTVPTDLVFGAGTVTATERMRIYSDGGVVVGSPTGGSKGAGSINAVAVYRDGTALDFVFDSQYQQLTIDDMKVHIDKNNCLPWSHQSEDYVKASGSVEIGSRTEFLIETVENYAKYIIELEERIRKLESGSAG